MCGELEQLTYEFNYVRIILWDTPGSERFKSITYSYCEKVQGLLLVFDISDRSSFDEIPDWISEIHKRLNKEVIIYLVANKIDTEERRKVTKEEGESMAKRCNIKYFETSAEKILTLQRL